MKEKHMVKLFTGPHLNAKHPRVFRKKHGISARQFRKGRMAYRLAQKKAQAAE